MNLITTKQENQQIENKKVTLSKDHNTEVTTKTNNTYSKDRVVKTEKTVETLQIINNSVQFLRRIFS